MDTKQKIENLIAFARSLEGAPYQDGMYMVKPEDDQSTFDCSSLVQYVFHKVGVQLPRSTILQAAAEGTEIASLEEARPGDILFFEGERGHYRHDLFPDRKLYIGHVGIYTGSESMIHATRNVGYSGVVEHDLAPETNSLYNRDTVVLIKRFL